MGDGPLGGGRGRSRDRARARAVRGRASRARRLLSRRRRAARTRGAYRVSPPRARARPPRADAAAHVHLSRFARAPHGGALAADRAVRRARGRSAALDRAGGDARPRALVGRCRRGPAMGAGAPSSAARAAEARLREGHPRRRADPRRDADPARPARGGGRDDPADRAALPVEPRSADRIRAPDRPRGLEDDAGGPGARREGSARDRRAQREARRRHGDGAGPSTSCTARRAGIQAEACFMGWERKRGKLEELNRLLRGREDTSYERHVGDPEGLRGIRFVITLDSDTQLPMGSAARLVGLLAHPLNRAVFDETTGRVVSGYTIVQPRIETSPSSAREHALLADLRRRRRVRHLHARGVRRVSGPLRLGDLRRQGHLRGRRVHAQRRGTRAGERPRQPRSLRGHPRTNGARHRHRSLRRIPFELRRPREATAPLGARRLAAPAVAVRQGAVGARRADPQPAAAHRPLEDRRQPPAEPRQRDSSHAPRLGLDVAPRKAR